MTQSRRKKPVEKTVQREPEILETPEFLCVPIPVNDARDKIQRDAELLLQDVVDLGALGDNATLSDSSPVLGRASALTDGVRYYLWPDKLTAQQVDQISRAGKILFACARDKDLMPTLPEAILPFLYGAGLRCVDEQNDTALQEALDARNRQLTDAFLAIARENPEFLFHANNAGDTALHQAVEIGNKIAAQALIEAGKDHPNLLFHPNNNGNTALHFAIYNDDKEATQALIKAGKKQLLFHPNNAGDTALHWAVDNGDIEATKALIEAGKKHPELLFHPKNDGNTALHFAIYNDDKEATQALIEAGKDHPNLLFHPNNDGNTALHRAVAKGDEEATQALIEAGKRKPELLLITCKTTGKIAAHGAGSFIDKETARKMAAVIPEDMNIYTNGFVELLLKNKLYSLAAKLDLTREGLEEFQQSDPKKAQSAAQLINGYTSWVAAQQMTR